ncbi:MFS transporter (plasmid) [Paraburkholderia sp. PGU19]|uniref:MFS transporter n=1 Tax=Paraburkholderia sp. PGU19 TaxID=2735434 RepID=UPI0015DBC639|nr:MFS transporter [Paraburkholderia sp. PGU19]BCG04186.1 MFS transporter [Paraburkholderia sp. PGU19]
MVATDQNCMRKVLMRFLPLLLVCYIVSHLDRVNIGYAALTMNQALGLSNAAFGLGAGLFFITYFVFEIPSNLVLKRFGARRWIARIMLTWGILSGSMAFVQGETSFYVIRLLLGAAEAGFFPGIIFFLTLWVPSRWRATFIGTFMVAVPMASVLGAPISAFLINGAGFWGLASWQTMFIVEAVPAILLAFVVYKVLRDKPEDAEWLNDEEKRWLMDTLDEERAQVGKYAHESIGVILRTPQIWLLAYIYFCLAGISYGLAFFLPLIMKEAHLSIIQTGFATAAPFLVGAVGMVLWGRSSDRHQERRGHALVALGLAVFGLVASVVVPSPMAKIIAFSVSALGLMSALPVFWTLPNLLLKSTVGAAGIAMISSLGNLSGFVQSVLMGVIRDRTGSFSPGLLLIAAVGAVGFVVLLRITRHVSRPATQVSSLTSVT